MGDKPPATDRSGIERRDILNGLGFGVMSIVGVSAMSGRAVAQPNLINVGITPTNEDLEITKITGDIPKLKSSNGTYDLVAFIEMDQHRSVVGYQFTILTRDNPPKIISRAIYEGMTEAVTQVLRADANGIAELRHTFHIETLNTGQYIAVLTLLDYSNIDPTSVVRHGKMRGILRNLTSGDSLNAENMGMVVAHAFDVT